MGRAQVPARVAAPVLAAQPLAVHQVGAGQVDGAAAAFEAGQGLAVEPLGTRAVVQQGARAGQHAEGPVGAGRPGAVLQPAQGHRGPLGGVGAGGRLDEFGEGEAVDGQVLVRNGPFRVGQGVLIAAEAVVEDGDEVVLLADRAPLAP